MNRRELAPEDYLAMLRRRWVLIVSLAIIGGPLAYGVSRFLPSRYSSQTLVLIEQSTVPIDIVKPVISSDINERLASMKEQILSRSRLEPIISQYGLYAADVKSVPVDDLVARLQKAIDVTPIKPMEETSTHQLPGFNVTVTMDSARTAQQVCTAVTSMFIEENLRLRQEHSENTTDFLAQRLDSAKRELDEQDSKLAVFKSHYLGALPDDEQSNLNILNGLSSQLEAVTQDIGRAQQEKAFNETMLAQQLDAWQAAQSGHNPQTLEQQLATLQTQLAELQTHYTDSYPDVIKVKNDIDALKKKIAEDGQEPSGSATSSKTPKSTIEPDGIARLRGQIHAADQVIKEKTAEQEDLKRQIKLYQGRIQSSPSVEQQYKELTRGYETALATYNELQKKRDDSATATDLERRQEGEQFRVLDPANLPDKPSFPNRPLFALGGLAGGLGLGLGLAFLLEMQDTSIRNERDVEFALRLPVIAMLPAIGAVTSAKVKRSDGGLTSGSERGAQARA